MSEQNKAEKKWPDVASATHGLSITMEQAEVWEYVMAKSLPGIKNSEICIALFEAMLRKEPTERYCLTSGDIVSWVKKSRNKWAERVEIKNGVAYFVDRPHICGQIQSRKAMEEEMGKDQRHR